MKILDVLNSPWAIIPAKLEEITEIYARHMTGPKLSKQDIEALRITVGKPMDNKAKGYQVLENGVALLPIDGVLSKRMNMFADISGGTSTQLLERDLNQALMDPAVSSVILQIDSPGGAVDGTEAVARAVFNARSGSKPVVAWVDGTAASAAYWIGSAADAMFTGAETDVVGSIGVAMQHVDRSKSDQSAGITRTDIYSGKYKRIASDNAPLSDEGRAYLQSQADYFYSLFVDAVSAHRGVTVEHVVTNMADGRIFIGQQAIDAGLVDGVSTLDALIADLGSGKYTPRRRTVAGVAAVIGDRVIDPGVDASAAGAAAEQDTPTDEKESSMDLATLKLKHPEVAQALIAEGHAAGLAEGRTAGASAELARVLAVEAQSMPGHEQLIAALKADGKTTGPEAAVQVLAAEKAKKATVLTNLRADAPNPAAAAANQSGEHNAQAEAAAAEANLPLAERAKAAFDRDPKIREEFGTVERYTGFLKHEELRAA